MMRFKPISITASATLNYKVHGRAVLVLNKADGLTLTLPAASGSGADFNIVIGTTISSNDAIIAAAGSDIIQGVVAIATDVAGVTCPTASNTDTITMNGGTKGGIKGTSLRLVDVASGVWVVSGFLVSSSTEATPFSGT